MDMDDDILSILDLQRVCVGGILRGCGEEEEDEVGFGGSERGGEFSEERWKVLVYDVAGRDILAPLFKVSDLRGMGVTLHLLLDSTRQSIPDVPAVYFCAPTEHNLRRIVEDCGANLYEEMFVNFTSTVPRPLLEKFGEDIAALPRMSAIAIRRVYDGFCNFLSLENDLFTLDLPNSYTLLNSLKDQEVEDTVDRIVTGLFSVIATTGQVPIVRAQPGGPAELVATNLDQHIRDALSVRNNVFTESKGPLSLKSSPQRPLLIILDRSIDLPVMLHHTWSYQALTHDLLEMRLNRVVINIKEGSETFASGRRSFDLDKSDPFWAENAGNPFPKVAVAVQKALEDYKLEVAEINRKAGAIGGLSEDELNGTDKLAKALQTLPELTKRKQRIDLHTNLATALLNEIKDRNLDAFFSAEDHVMSRSTTTDKDTVLNLLRDSAGTPEDKMRLFIIYALCGGANADLDTFETVLDKAGCDLRALRYVKKIRAFTDQVDLQSIQAMSLPSVPSQPAIADIGLGKMMSSLVEHGTKGLTQVANNFNKLILDEDKALECTRVVEALMECRGKEEITEQYLYFDARQPRKSVTRSRKPVRDAIVFMVGGGNYVEYQNTKDHLRHGKHIVYGCTDFVHGEEFLRQMETLSGEPKKEQHPNNT